MKSMIEIHKDGVIEMCNKGFTIDETVSILHIRKDVVIKFLEEATE